MGRSPHPRSCAATSLKILKDVDGFTRWAYAISKRSSRKLQYGFHRWAIHAGGAYIVFRLGDAILWLESVHGRSRIRTAQNVIRAHIRFLSKLSNFFFKLSANGALFCIRDSQRRSRRIQLQQLATHVDLERIQLDLVPDLDGRSDRIPGTGDCPSNFFNAHKSSFVVNGQCENCQFTGKEPGTPIPASDEKVQVGPLDV